MKKLSSSPDRNTFQKEKYIARCKEEGKEPSEAYLNMWDDVNEQNSKNAVDTEWQKNNLEYDLRICDWILEKVRTRDEYAQNLYAAMCNNEFQKREMWPILKEETWSCTWRYAGGIVADMLEKGDYIDWYCSGMGGLSESWDKDAEDFSEWQLRTKYMPEGAVTEEIQQDLFKLGWIVVDKKDA
jgi:hypothetical protein